MMNYRKLSKKDLLMIIKHNDVEYVRLDGVFMLFYPKKTGLFSSIKDYKALDLNKAIDKDNFIYKQNRKNSFDDSDLETQFVSNLLKIKDVVDYIENNENTDNIYNDLKFKMEIKTEDFIGDKTYENAKSANDKVGSYFSNYGGKNLSGNKMQIFKTITIGGQSGSHTILQSFNFKQGEWDSVPLFNNSVSNCIRKKSLFTSIGEKLSVHCDFEIGDFVKQAKKELFKNKQKELIESVLQIQKSLIFNNDKFLTTAKQKNIFQDIKGNHKNHEDIVDNIDKIMRTVKTQMSNVKKNNKKHKKQ